MAPRNYLGASFGSCFAKGEVTGREKGADCEKHRWNHDALRRLMPPTASTEEEQDEKTED